jgi:hypothetical protein
MEDFKSKNSITIKKDSKYVCQNFAFASYLRRTHKPTNHSGDIAIPQLSGTRLIIVFVDDKGIMRLYWGGHNRIYHLVTLEFYSGKKTAAQVSSCGR